ncbi:acetoin utilization protein AcuC [Gammaproteobacteria bacterium]
MTHTVSLYVGEELSKYGFDSGHPFGRTRQGAFWDEVRGYGLDGWAWLRDPISIARSWIELFHTPEYVSFVEKSSEAGRGYLDQGDTPVFPGIYETSSFVVGSVVQAVREVMEKKARHAFIPIAGLHHARPERAAGFCVFNDLGVAIEVLKREYGLSKIAYVDIDAHHGDGVYYPFESDPAVIFADLHEDGRFLYPGTGHAHEQGIGKAVGTKLNIPLRPDTDDEGFFALWPRVEEHLRSQRPEFILLQGGVDSLAGDTLSHLRLSPRAHAFATKRLIEIAEDLCEGRLVVTGGGGYNLSNVARGWTAILRALLGLE